MVHESLCSSDLVKLRSGVELSWLLLHLGALSIVAATSAPAISTWALRAACHIMQTDMK
jgi:hypothetical protein